MPDRIALVADDDTEFRLRLGGVLSRLGLRVQESSGERETLDLLKRLGPDIVFVGVDLPEQEGFALFSKIKKVRRRVPVVLATSTVSAEDLKLHEKLKIHAEAYLDRRTATDEELVELLTNRIGLAADDEVERAEPETQTETESQLEEPPRAEMVTVSRVEKTAVEPWLAPLLDPETAAALADFDEEGALLEAAPRRNAPDGEVSPERVSELEDEVDRLKKELEQTRRDAQSSPFSGEFLALREESSRRDKEIRELRDVLGRRHGQVAVIKAKLTELARKLLDAEKDRDRRFEESSDLRAELESAQAKLARLERELADQERRYERETKSHGESVSAIESRYLEVRKELESEVSTLKAQHARVAQTKDEEHAAALAELEKKLRGEKGRLVDELKSRYTEKLKEIHAGHAQTTATLRKERQKEIESLHASHHEAAARTAAEAQEALRQAAENSAAALERANQQRLAELGRLEEKRREDAKAAEKRRREEIEALSAQRNSERDSLTRDLEAARTRIERISTEFGAKVQDVVKSLDEERKRHQETREHYERELQTVQLAHTQHLEQAEQDQFSALASLSRKFREDRERLLELERKRWQERVDKLEKEHAQARESLEKRYEDQIRELTAARDDLLQKREDAVEQTSKRAVAKVRAELSEEIERSKRAHADELAVLRQDHEKEISSLQAGHMEAIQKRDRESQQSLRDAVEAAKADWSDKLEQSRDESREALAAQRREYEEEIAALERAHQDSIAKRDQELRDSLRRTEEDRDAARTESDGLKAELAEMEARHRSTSAIVEERHKGEIRELQKELKGKIATLEEEKQFLASSVEKLKRQSTMELSRALDSLAHEKKLHQSSQDRYERRLIELNTRHAEGIKQIEADWMAKFEALEKSLIERSGKAYSGLERDLKSRIEKERFGHEEAVQALKKDYEAQLATEKKQLDGLRGLEETYQASARELMSMRARVEELEASLEASRKETADRERALADEARRSAESGKTIDSLKAVIDDFSRSVEGYMRDREESDQTISSLKAVIDDFYRSIGGGSAGGRKN